MGKKKGPVLRQLSFHDIDMSFDASTMLVTVDAELDPPGSVGWTLFSVDVRYQTRDSAGTWSSSTSVPSVSNVTVTPPNSTNTHWQYHGEFTSPTGDGTTRHRLNLQANWTGAHSEDEADDDFWVPPSPVEPPPPSAKAKSPTKKAKEKPAKKSGKGKDKGKKK